METSDVTKDLFVFKCGFCWVKKKDLLPISLSNFDKFSFPLTLPRDFYKNWIDTVKLGNKERFDNEKIGVKDCDQFPVYFIKIRNIWR